MKQKNRLWRKDKLVLSDICHLLSILLSNCPPTDVNGKIYLLWPLHRCWQHIGPVQWRTKHVSWMGVSTNTSRYLHFGLYLFNLRPFWDVQVSLFQTLLCLNIGKKKGAQTSTPKQNHSKYFLLPQCFTIIYINFGQHYGTFCLAKLA